MKPKKTDPSGLPIRCYDNFGTSKQTIDRFTVVYLDTQHLNRHNDSVYDSVGMSSDPFHPQGVGMHGDAVLGKHLGKVIPFSKLPAKCQQLVKQDLADYKEENPEIRDTGKTTYCFDCQKTVPLQVRVYASDPEDEVAQCGKCDSLNVTENG